MNLLNERKPFYSDFKKNNKTFLDFNKSANKSVQYETIDVIKDETAFKLKSTNEKNRSRSLK